ncbi:condensation domain-containing protein [Hydrocoleum sp. CS-953]|uniref:condensation domain-containing protein n=1 Tax=Hydrocoleum sp. CS-953 TaxID=1671698 RepID=UPI001FEF286A|nr:condensation domain-containing protein [Hydrocoleum sp. CS-953]
MAQDKRGSTAYNESITFELRGRLAIDRLRNAIQTVIHRHDALRTSIAADGLHQIVTPVLDIEIPLLDYSSEDAPDEALDRWLLAESQQTFDLYRGPLIRATIIKLSPERYAFNICTHHLISDGWSLVAILEEISKIYSGCLDIPQIQQFTDYLQWYNQDTQSDAFKTSELFWSEHLRTVSPLRLPLDYPDPEQRTYNGARISTKIPSDLTLALKQRSMAWNATLFHTLLGAYVHQITKFCQTNAIAIGISVSGRPTHLAEHLVGYCSHFIPIYQKTDKKSTWSQQVQQTKAALSQAFKHQNLPLARILAKMPQEQQENLIQVTFNLDLAMAIDLVGLQTQIIPQPVTSARYAMGLNVIPELDSLHFDLDYNTDYFKAETMQEFLGNLQRFSFQ